MIKDRKYILHGLGRELGRKYQLHNKNMRMYVLQIGLSNIEFRKGLAKGFRDVLPSFGNDLTDEISRVYFMNYLPKLLRGGGMWVSMKNKRYSKISLIPRVRGSGPDQLQNSSAGFFVYERNKISIQYPIDWTAIEGKNPVLVHLSLASISPPLTMSLDYRVGPKYPYIEISRNYEPNSLTECIHKTVDEYKEKIADVKVVKVETNAVLSGHPAYELVYIQQMGKIRKTTLKSIEVGTVVNNMKYSINYVMNQTNFQQYYDVFSTMKNSLSIYE